MATRIVNLLVGPESDGMRLDAFLAMGPDMPSRSACARLVEEGSTVVVIEHNLDVIKTADYVIDLGPEGGDAGGQVIATGTPEEVAQNPKSYTGQFLARTLVKQ